MHLVAVHEQEVRSARVALGEPALDALAHGRHAAELGDEREQRTHRQVAVLDDAPRERHVEVEASLGDAQVSLRRYPEVDQVQRHSHERRAGEQQTLPQHRRAAA